MYRAKQVTPALTSGRSHTPPFQVCKTVADSGDMMIQKRGFATVDTHVPAIAISLSPDLNEDVQRRRNRILLGGPPQEVRRFDSPGLHASTLRDDAQRDRYVDSREVHNSLPSTKSKSIGDQWSREARRSWRGSVKRRSQIDNHPLIALRSILRKVSAMPLKVEPAASDVVVDLRSTARGQSRSSGSATARQRPRSNHSSEANNTNVGRL
jgi:hypothetical protein